MEYYLKTEDSFLGKITVDFDNLLVECIEETRESLEEKPPIMIFGKQARQQRNVGFFSNETIGYRYSGKIAKSNLLTPKLNILLKLINNLFDTDFNGILINEYPDGTHYIGKHSDDEAELSNIGVVCMSYGAPRKFRIRDKLTNKIVIDVPTQSREILIMGGNFQQHFTHEIPVEKKVKEPRFSFTFRKHIT